MAKGEQINVEIVSEYDDKDAKKAIADAEKIDDLKPEIEVESDVSRVLSAFDDVIAEAKDVQAAADALSQALGPDLAAKADTTRIVQQLQDAGLAIDTIKTNADELGAKLREAADTDVGGRLGASLGTARGKMDELAVSAGSSRSVLANMVGNSVQDLGALSGVAGSAGVALGQMGEYMADARASGEGLGSILKNFGTVAGPIAGIAIATQLIGSALSKGKDEQEKLAAETRKWVDALLDAVAAGKSLAEATDDIATDKVKELLSSFSASSLTALQNYGVTFDEMVEAVGSGSGEVADLVAEYKRLDETVAAGAGSQAEANDRIRDSARAHGEDAEAALQRYTLGRLLNDVLGDEIDLSEGRGKASKAAAEFMKADADATKNLTDAQKAGKSAQDAYVDGLIDRNREGKEATRTAEEQAEADRLAAEAAQESADAHQANADAINAMVTAQRAAADATFALHDAEAQLAEQLAGLPEALADAGDDWNKVRAVYEDVTDSAADVADAQVRVAEETAAAQGKTVSATQKLDAWNDSMIEQASTMSGPARQAILDYIASVNGIPPEKMTEILALLDQGKVAEAEAELDRVSEARDSTITADAETGAAEDDLNNVARDRDTTVTVHTKLNMPQWLRDILASGGNPLVRVGPTSMPVPPDGGGPVVQPVATGTQVVNINMPRGSRGVDVVRQVAGQARRSGRRYGARVVHYANR